MGFSAKPPVIDFIRIAHKNGGIDADCLHHLGPWLFKLILLEPLRLLEFLLYDKKIRDHQLAEAPVFILGFYRNGTTLLQRMFALDPRFGYQKIFHSAFPEVMLVSESTLKPLLTNLSRILRVKNAMHGIPFEWDFPGEEDVALTSLTIAESVNWGNLYPSSFDRYYEEYAWSPGAGDATRAWLDNYQLWVKKLSLRNGGKRLVLKSPPNTARLKLLSETFPGAKFICIFRDPYQVFASSRRFWKIINRHYALKSASDDEIERIVLKSFDETMKRYHETKALLSGMNVYELTYEHLVQDPLGQFRKIIFELKLGDFEPMASGIKAFLDSSRDYPKIKYELTTQEKEIVAQKWQQHIAYWDHLMA